MAAKIFEYDVVEFAPVSIAEAKAAQNDDVKTRSFRPSWEHRRRPQQQSDLKLEEETIEWLLNLPERVRPLRLARKYPRIVNNIAREWKRPVSCDSIFEELMIDNRGTREGFTFEIAKEIADLRAYFCTEVFQFDKFNVDMWVIAP